MCLVVNITFYTTENNIVFTPLIFYIQNRTNSNTVYAMKKKINVGVNIYNIIYKKINLSCLLSECKLANYSKLECRIAVIRP